MADAKQGAPGGSVWVGLIVFLGLMSLGFWGGWAARGKMDECTDRPDYGALDLGKDAVVATGSGIADAAIWTKDVVVAGWNKVFN